MVGGIEHSQSYLVQPAFVILLNCSFSFNADFSFHIVESVNIFLCHFFLKETF
jgi:hypothetical protein